MKNKQPTRLLLFLSALLSFIFFSSSVIASGALVKTKLSSQLLEIVDTLSGNQELTLWIFFTDKEVASSISFISERSIRRRSKVDPDNYLIDERDIPISESYLTTLEMSGYKIRHKSKWFNAVSVTTARDGIVYASNLPFVRKVSLVKKFNRFDREIGKPVEIQEKTLSEFGSGIALDYGLSLLQNQFIRADKLHRSGLTGLGVYIAIFDSGFKTNHPAFDSTSIIATYDFINNVTPVDSLDCSLQVTSFQQNFHGTSVLGVIGGYSPGNLIGSAYNADFALAKTEITCDGTEIKIEEDNWIAAAEWADSIGADIISSSLGYYFFQDSLDYSKSQLDGNTALITIAADIAASKNILIINSAGNERKTSWGKIIFPADGDSVIAVGAVLPDSSLASFSSFGPSADGRIKPDVTTLGIGVVTPSFLGGFNSLSGTSFSAPLVAAGAALAFEHDPTMTAEQYRNLLKTTSDRADFPDNDFGYGLFDAVKSADIIKIDNSKKFRISIGDTRVLHITTSGRTDSIPSMTALNLPVAATFIDSGNGSATLRISGIESNGRVTSFQIALDIGYFTDTTTFTLETYASVTQQVIAAPNPFKNNVSFILSSNSGDLKSISIFNISGEKVWEYLNATAVSADETIVWDGLNTQGNVVSDGVYLAFIKTENFESRIKLLKIE